MVLAAVGAGLLGAWFEGAFLLFLFSVGHALEHRAMERARRAIEALGRLRPETARVQARRRVVEIPVGAGPARRAGDGPPGRPRPARRRHPQRPQRRWIRRRSPANPSPSPRGPGDEVFAGTINTEAALEIEVTKLSSESVLARVVDMVDRGRGPEGPHPALRPAAGAELRADGAGCGGAAAGGAVLLGTPRQGGGPARAVAAGGGLALRAGHLHAGGRAVRRGPRRPAAAC